MKNFYDKVAREFGGYGFSTIQPKYNSVYPFGNPEAIFKEHLGRYYQDHLEKSHVKLGRHRVVYVLRKPTNVKIKMYLINGLR